MSDINLANHPGLINLLEDGETPEDLKKLSPEQILIRWVNYHLRNAGVDRRIRNFQEDIKVLLKLVKFVIFLYVILLNNNKLFNLSNIYTKIQFLNLDVLRYKLSFNLSLG